MFLVLLAQLFSLLNFAVLYTLMISRLWQLLYHINQAHLSISRTNKCLWEYPSNKKEVINKRRKTETEKENKGLEIRKQKKGIKGRN